MARTQSAFAEAGLTMFINVRFSDVLRFPPFTTTAAGVPLEHNFGDLALEDLHRDDWARKPKLIMAYRFTLPAASS